MASLIGISSNSIDGPAKWDLKNSSSQVVKSDYISSVSGDVYESWSVNINTTDCADGNYTFQVAFKDAATNNQPGKR